MPLSDELEKLDGLRQRGVLSDDEFARAKARLLEAPPCPLAPGLLAVNGLRRSRSDRWLGGVCGGMGRATEVDAWVWRLGFTVLALWGSAGLMLYGLMWLFLPRE